MEVAHLKCAEANLKNTTTNRGGGVFKREAHSLCLMQQD